MEEWVLMEVAFPDTQVEWEDLEVTKRAIKQFANCNFDLESKPLPNFATNR